MLKLCRAPTRTLPSPNTSPPSRSNPLLYRTIPIIFSSIAIFAFSGYSTYLYIVLSRAPATPISSSPRAQADVSSRYDTIARSFDESVDWSETVLRITKLRKKLLSKAKGDVLEVSIGTGRNLEYYDWGFQGQVEVRAKKEGKVKSFTAVDKSSEMLDVAHEKFSTLIPVSPGARWIVGDASEEIPSAPAGAGERQGTLEVGKYDTIVQTMGLCSADDPVALLKNLGKYVKEEEGRILLLEHGRGSSEWLNGVLDKFAENHAKKFGCWWNRDLEKIVRESGLEVVDMHSVWYHAGTTWWIELKKPKGKVEHTAGAQALTTKLQRDEGSRKKWW
jgi:methyltransferase OMS1